MSRDPAVRSLSFSHALFPRRLSLFPSHECASLSFSLPATLTFQGPAFELLSKESAFGFHLEKLRHPAGYRLLAVKRTARVPHKPGTQGRSAETVYLSREQ